MSHHLREIQISNFKSIKREKFELSVYTPLVGYNNAGKTNVLYAIKWLFKKSSLGIEMFNRIGDPVIVEGKITGITEDMLVSLEPAHRTSIQDFIKDGELHIQRKQGVPNDTTANIKLSVRNLNSATPDDWVPNPTGIDNALIRLFPEPIHIGAMENSEEDVSKSSRSSTIGKLLAETIVPIEQAYGEQLSGALASLRNLLDADGSSRAPELSTFDVQVNQKIDSFFPGINIKLHVPTPELKEVFSKGTIKVYESESLDGRDVDSLGHGAQRSIQMALIRHLADLKRNTEGIETTTLLLIDEPELYLHPQAVELVRDSLKLLSREGYQIIFSTHSAGMIGQDDIGNAILIRKDVSLGTYCRKTLKTSIADIERDATSQITLLFSLSNSSSILFSEKVFLVEGATEERVLPKIVESITGKTLGIHKTALVKLSGSGSTKKALGVLRVMDVPSKSIADFDFCFTRAVEGGFLNSNDSDLVACKTLLSRLASGVGINLDVSGLPMRGGSMTVEKTFEYLASQPEIALNIQALHDKLRAQGVWVWKMGAIEKHLGITGKTEAAWSAFVENLVSRPFDDVVFDHVGVRECVDWLIT